jgi:two-component sensor histidine kinase
MVDTAQFASDLNVARFVDKLREEHDPATRALLHRLLLEEWNKSGFNLKQLGKLRRQMIASGARIAIQKAVVETLAANGQDVRLAEGVLSNLVEIQKIFEQRYRDERMGADLCAMTLLWGVGSLCAREGKNLDKCLHGILDVGIAIARADKGNIQLLEHEAVVLTMAAQRGFGHAFLKYFECVRDGPSACAAAMRSGERVIVEDVTTSEIFIWQPSMNVLVQAGVRAVTSTLLISSAGNRLGMISTHFREPHHPSERELGFMDLLARQAADYLERKRVEDIEETRVREIQHRSSNQLAVVQTIAHQTLSGDPSLAEAKRVFDARLQALAQANRQLNKSSWSRVNLSEMVHSAMAPFGDRMLIDGVGVMVGAQHAQSFSLALHELATNAAKYGALSTESGRVKIFWTITPDGKDNRLKFKWKETGGSPVVAPAGHGFGTSLLKATFPDVRIDYSVEGLTCEIDVVLGRAEPGASSNPQFRRNLTSDGLRPGCCIASRPSDASP